MSYKKAKIENQRGCPELKKIRASILSNKFKENKKDAF